MSERAANNRDYLLKAMAWLEAILKRRLEQNEAMATKLAAGKHEEIRQLEGKEAAAKKLAAGGEEEILRLYDEMDAAANCLPQPYLVELGQRFKLSRFESSVLLLFVCVELEGFVMEYCGWLLPREPRRSLSLALACSLFDDPDTAAFAPDAPLRRWRLLEIHQPNGEALISSAIRADERIVNHALGLTQIDSWLSLWIRRLDLPESLQVLPDSQRAVLKSIENQMELAQRAETMPVVELLGQDASSKRTIAWCATDAAGRELYYLPAENLPASASEIETMSLLWRRECKLADLALYLDAQDLDQAQPKEGSAHPVSRFLSTSKGLIFLAAIAPWSRLGRDTLPFDVAKPTSLEQRAIWQLELREDCAGEIPEELAGQFNLNVETILKIVKDLRADELRRDQLFLGRSLRDRLWADCRAAVRPRLDGLAERIESDAGWRDLVLPRDMKRQLWQIANHVRYRDRVFEDWGFARKMSRGLGLSVLFAGESGTGKTMAAEVLSNTLRLDLFRIDLSAVVSKYIGETEKNLRRVFDAAEDGGAILFFDEADALFGKRSEVKDSHDRYANIEINYLLQRMEAYRGLAILATNMKKSLDTAFMRRLRFVVDFAFPDVKQRKRIWRRAFPKAGINGDLPHVSLADLDYDRLAAFDLTGGSIANTALSAAFFAAEEGRRARIDMKVVLRAIRAEYLKLGRPIVATDFALAKSKPKPAGVAR